MSKNNLATAGKLYSVEEYLAFEREAAEKHEFVDGEIIAMAGSSRRHNLISGNVFAEIRFQLKGKNCETYTNDVRVQMPENRYSYPDVVVVCGKPEFVDDNFDVLLNPTVAVEVLSKSTRFRDKTEKLEAFLRMESVRECLLIEQDKSYVEHYIKQTPKQWLLKIYEGFEEIINLESIGCAISLADIYAQVNFHERSE